MTNAIRVLIIKIQKRRTVSLVICLQSEQFRPKSTSLFIVVGNRNDYWNFGGLT